MRQSESKKREEEREKRARERQSERKRKQKINRSLQNKRQTEMAKVREEQKRDCVHVCV